ncbi:PadR family transcriptional regulator [Micromonospora sp. NPDC000089]|uniref:PadR family transcriptional regulator n=1 Tax=unclassified Micromonospora TaxID=2617518 RepID=UPI00368A9DE3
MTLPTQLVLRAFLDQPEREFYGLELCTAAGLASGTVHPILARLERQGWVCSRWEQLDPREAGRPRRRYYSMTPDGAEKAHRALVRASSSVHRLKTLRPGLAGGPA